MPSSDFENERSDSESENGCEASDKEDAQALFCKN